MPTRTIITLTALTATNTSNAWNYIAGPAAVNENSNPQFNRTVVLTQTGVLVTQGGNGVGVPMETLMQVCAKANPLLTWPPNFTGNGATQPANAYIGQGNSNATSFTGVAVDEIGGDITYQWQYSSNKVNVAASTPFSNVTTGTLNISNTATVFGVGFVLLATNPSGSNYSSAAYVVLDPAISQQPSNATVVHPAPASFSVVASGSNTLSYQWQAAGSNITTAGTANYANWTTNTLNVGNSNGLNGTLYRVIVSDAVGSLTSNNGLLTVS